MALVPDARLGSYEIVELIGAGGMGEVYRATDTHLKRAVAIKVLLEAVATDAERIARFQREAEVLARLNHPNIAQIHGLEKSDGMTALVMELVEGPTLAERIAQGPIPLDEALPIARQIADALEAAHEHGVVHRDLKPANIKLKPDGAVKVLDFGLAKAMEAVPGTHGISMSPTLTSPAATRVGTLLGTASYMSPEQARGKAVDKRADVWAFGCVVFEMLTGKRAFEGEDVSLTLAEVMKSEPAWTALPHHVPASVRAALKHCLQKNPKARLRDIADVRLLMEGAVDNAEAPSPVDAGSFWQYAAGIGVTAIVFLALGGLAVWSLMPRTASPVMRALFTLPEGHGFTGTGRHVVAMSPDGTQLAYVANTQLFLRRISELEARPIQGTEIGAGVLNPVFSPDGQSIAFWSAADQTIKRVSVSGGAPVTVCQAATRPFGITWQDDVILFGQGGAGISRVSANGGAPERVAAVKSGEAAHGPQLLPGGRALLFTIASGTTRDRWDKAQVVVQQLSSGERKTVVHGGSDARYVPTGHLVYAGGVLFAVPFDPNSLETAGAAAPIVQGVRRSDTSEINTGAAQFSFSQTGLLAYIPGPESVDTGTRDLAFVDRKGNVERLKLPPGTYETPRVSPDGSRIAYSSAVGNAQAIYIYELSGTSAPRRLTFGGRSHSPVWSRDGERVAFQSDHEGDLAVFRQRADGTDSAAQRLTKPDAGASHTPESWSPRGDILLFSEFKNAMFSLWSLSLRDNKVELFGDVKSPSPLQAMFSPNGQWVAYRSAVVGTSMVYVQPFPATGAQFEIARGNSPVWSFDGAEIYTFSGLELGVSAITTRPTVNVGARSVLRTPGFQWAVVGLNPRSFDVAPDGKIVGPISTGSTEPGTSSGAQIHIVTNWFEELKRVVPTK